jgi:hypothetical protein
MNNRNLINNVFILHDLGILMDVKKLSRIMVIDLKSSNNYGNLNRNL